MKSAMRKGQELLKKKEERLSQLESSLLEEVALSEPARKHPKSPAVPLQLPILLGRSSGKEPLNCQNHFCLSYLPTSQGVGRPHFSCYCHVIIQGIDLSFCLFKTD